jgi:hypothetical protein
VTGDPFKPGFGLSGEFHEGMKMVQPVRWHKPWTYENSPLKPKPGLNGLPANASSYLADAAKVAGSSSNTTQ